LWSITLFEQQTLSSLLKLEQAIFGKLLTQENNEKVSISTIIESGDEKPQIIKQAESQVVDASIQFKPELNVEFQVVEVSPYSSNKPIPVDEPLVQGVIYKIQLGAFSNPKGIDWFKGITPLSAENVSGGKVTKYYAGKFSRLANAEKALSTIKGMGFKDAFIVAWHNGRTVALSRAQSLEDQVSPTQSTEKVSIQIEETGKSYMIQIGNYKGRLPDDVMQTVRALAPGKDVVRKPDNAGGFIYSLGSFSTANEANRVKDNLIASGVGSAKVVIVENE
jgi:cell division septation protein DedD